MVYDNGLLNRHAETHHRFESYILRHLGRRVGGLFILSLEGFI